MIAFDEALALLAKERRTPEIELVPLAEASGRILAKDLIAPADAPLHPVSMMDGYAVRLDEVLGGSLLKLVAVSRAGAGWAGPLNPGEAARVFTGARVPTGADCVIMQEYAEDDGASVRFRGGHGPARHIRDAGSDFGFGDVLLTSGTRLSPRALVAAAAADLATIPVARKPRVALMTIGDELASPGTARGDPERIPDTLAAALTAVIDEWGGHAVSARRLRDEPTSAGTAAGDALAEADLVIVAGGASVGDHDLARPVFARLGAEPIFARVAIKPGRPVWLARCRQRLVLGLPGNPTSAMVTARLFLEPLLRALQGTGVEHAWRELPLTAPLAAVGVRETFVRARWGTFGLHPLENQLSGSQAALAYADCLIRCAPGEGPRSAGTMVPALLF